MTQNPVENPVARHSSSVITRRNFLKGLSVLGASAYLESKFGPVFDLAQRVNKKEAKAEDSSIDLLPSPMQTLWRETDGPVVNGTSNLSWLWGDKAIFITEEIYDGVLRKVAYFDKSRMDLNPDQNAGKPWIVRNGLLVQEMVLGRLQTGDNEFEPKTKPDIKIVGDKVSENPSPTYAQVDQYLYPQTQTSFDVVAPEFKNYLSSFSQNYKESKLDWLFVTGWPISKPFWTRSLVTDPNTGIATERDVMVQLFERRALTYTPSNEGKWQIEMVNAGQDYYRWRYENGTGGKAEYYRSKGNGWGFTSTKNYQIGNEIFKAPVRIESTNDENLNQLEGIIQEYPDIYPTKVEIVILGSKKERPDLDPDKWGDYVVGIAGKDYVFGEIWGERGVKGPACMVLNMEALKLVGNWEDVKGSIVRKAAIWAAGGFKNMDFLNRVSPLLIESTALKFNRTP